MNEKMEATLLPVLTEALELAKATGTFVVDKAPEVVQQLLLWHSVQSILYTILAVVLTSFFIVFVVKFAKAAYADEDVWIALSISTGIIAFIVDLYVLIAEQWLVWIKIKCAPDLYLLEYAASLVK